jgi:Tfp pilus assembly protein PilN
MLPTRLNVLPPEKRKNLQRMIRNEFIRSGLSAIIIVASMLGIAFLGGKYVLQTYFSDLGDNLLAINLEAQERNISVRTINKRVKESESLLSVYQYWPDTIKLFSDVIPDTVYLTSLQIDTKTKRAVMTGRATTRESLLALGVALRELEMVQDAEIPLSDLTKPNDIEFDISITLKK